MSGPAERNGREGSGEDAAGVLANLPRTRPQRATPRRTASRRKPGAAGAEATGATAASGAKATGAAAAGAAKVAGRTAANAADAGPRETGGRRPAARPKAKRATAGTRPRSSPSRRTRPISEPEIPRQGFDCEEERATGTVAPPGASELVGTAAEIIGEIARFGITGGERVLRDVLGRLGR